MPVLARIVVVLMLAIAREMGMFMKPIEYYELPLQLEHVVSCRCHVEYVHAYTVHELWRDVLSLGMSAHVSICS